MDKHFLNRIHNETPNMYIGKVVEMTGATRKAIRHYETIGLIPPPQRKGLYRIYSDHDVFLIHMIKTSQAVGFSLAEVKELIERKVSEKTFPLDLANAIFDKKRKAFNQQIDDVKKQISQLDELQQQMLTHFD